ncbi:MAG: cyclic nucleotide-binding domain-containing protein [Ideonella sp.]|nr:cyclic nucleotide-binding domain-containing protein [Ideonella sp.]
MSQDSTPPRTRPLVDHPALAARAAELLITPLTGLVLAADETTAIVSRMGLIALPAGAAVLREGDDPARRFLLLLLEGEVEVDSRAGSSVNAVPLSVLGPGSMIGEMSLLDHAPRSATCIAVGPVLAAGLTREALDDTGRAGARARADGARLLRPGGAALSLTIFGCLARVRGGVRFSASGACATFACRPDRPCGQAHRGRAACGAGALDPASQVPQKVR